VLANHPDLPSDARHRLLRLLAERLGEMIGNDMLQASLSHLPLIPSMDGTFRPAYHSYADKRVLAVLGDGVTIAEPAPDEAIQALYNWLGVRQTLTPVDYVGVLVRVGRAVGGGKMPAETQTSVITCWQALDQASPEADLAILDNLPVLPNAQGELKRTDQIFVNDQPQLVAKFEGALTPYLLHPALADIAIMAQMGVRPISGQMTPDIATVGEATPAVAIESLLQERWGLLARVVAAENDATLTLARLEGLRVVWVEGIVVGWRVVVDGKVFVSVGEGKMPAKYHPTAHTLYLTQPTPWIPLARELATALQPNKTNRTLLTGFKDVLSADTTTHAHQILDELGYPP
jgi:hypothetical protein